MDGVKEAPGGAGRAGPTGGDDVAVEPWPIEPLGRRAPRLDGVVWYAAFGSNMNPGRLHYYLAGGRPPHGARTLPGCRDPRAPGRTVPVLFPGSLYFALESTTWTGGMAFHDPDGPGTTPACAHLVTVAQFSDIAAQEMGRAPGRDLDLTEVVSRGRATVGPGRYETLVCPGTLDGVPVVTFTAPWAGADVACTPPAAAYLRHLAAGLALAHGWAVSRVAGYLAGCPGAAGHWTVDAITALLTEPPRAPEPATPADVPGPPAAQGR